MSGNDDRPGSSGDQPAAEGAIPSAGPGRFAPDGRDEVPASLLDGIIAHFSGAEVVGELPDRRLAELRSQLRENGLLGDELVALWRLLSHTLARAGYRPPDGGEVRVLDLACGRCAEAALLGAFFGRGAAPGLPGPRVRFFALDLRDHEIDRARRRYAMTERLFRGLGLPLVAESPDSASPEIEFVADDALHLAGYGQIPSAFDIIFIRHQNVWHDRAIWRKIFSFALDRIEEAGMIVITSYFDREHMIALDLFRQLGGTIVATEANPRREELDYPGKSCDRHLAVIRRAPEAGPRAVILAPSR